MKKWIACLVILCLLAAMFTGCGKEESSLQETNENEQQPAAVLEAESKGPEKEEESIDGDLYDAGNVTVLVPKGWKAFPETDVFAEEDGIMNPDVLNVSKGGQLETDLFTKPYVRINYFGPAIQMGKPDASWYEDVKDIAPFTAGDHEWYGFTCNSLGTDLAILWCEEGSIQYQASIFLGSGDDTIAHEDADVQAILASVVPSDPNAAAMEAETGVLEEALDLSGCYRSPELDEEGAELWLEVFQYPDFLLLEFHKTIEGSVFTFWAEEYWPDEPCFGQWSSAHLTGKSQEFSPMSTGNQFTGMPRRRTITLTEDGLILQYEGFEEAVFLRDDSFCAHTDKEEQVEILWTQLEETDIDFDLVGTWDHWDGSRTIRLSMEADGCFRMLCKEPGLPVQVLRGIWGVGVDGGELLAYTEMTGGGKMPHLLCWQWELDEYGLLNIHGENPFRPEEGEGELQLWCAGSEDGLELMQAQAMGYLYSHYDMSGTYTDQYGTDYYYWYQVPQFLEDTGDLAEINTEMLDLFGPIIEEEMAAMEQGEFVSFDTVAWDAYVSEGILAIHVYSHAWEWEEHRTWYYDIQTGTRTDSLDLLKRHGISEEEFLSAVREHAEACYVEIFSGTPEEDRETYGYYDMLEWTVSDEAVNLDLPIFVDEVGNLCVYARIGSIAGAGEFWAPLYPFADWNMYAEAVG